MLANEYIKLNGDPRPKAMAIKNNPDFINAYKQICLFTDLRV